MAHEARKQDALGRFVDQDKTTKSGEKKDPRRGDCTCRETSIHRRMSDEKNPRPLGVIGNAADPAFEVGDARRIVDPQCPIHGDAASKAAAKK